MNPLLLYELIEALTMLRSGRANDAAEALAEAIREHGRVPVPKPTPSPSTERIEYA